MPAPGAIGLWGPESWGQGLLCGEGWELLWEELKQRRQEQEVETVPEAQVAGVTFAGGGCHPPEDSRKMVVLGHCHVWGCPCQM